MDEINEKLKTDPAAYNLYLGLKDQLDKLRRHARQGSYKTRERYYMAMLVFCRFLAVVYRMEKLANISGKHLASYVEYRQDLGLAPATVLSDLCAIRYWHDQMPNARYRLPDNDALAVDLEKRRFGGVDRTWSEEEYHAFVELARAQEKPDHAAALILAHELGLRIHETYRIDTAIARAALAAEKLTIKGKGGKIRQVPLTREAREVLEEQLAAVKPGEKLFVPAEQPSHLAVLGLQKFIWDHRNEIRDPANPVALTYHGLRHTYAANTYRRMRSQGRTEFEAHIGVSRLLGHERADVTEVYIVGCKEGYDNGYP